MKNKSVEYERIRSSKETRLDSSKGKLVLRRNSSRTVKTNQGYHTESKGFSVNILGAVIAILVGMTAVRVLADSGGQVSFYGFLNMLSNVPTVELSSVAPWFGDVDFTGIWQVFEPLIDFFVTSCQLGAYLAVSLWNALLYVLYFIGFLFGY